MERLFEQILRESEKNRRNIREEFDYDDDDSSGDQLVVDLRKSLKRTIKEYKSVISKEDMISCIEIACRAAIESLEGTNPLTDQW